MTDLVSFRSGRYRFRETPGGETTVEAEPEQTFTAPESGRYRIGPADPFPGVPKGSTTAVDFSLDATPLQAVPPRVDDAIDRLRAVALGMQRKGPHFIISIVHSTAPPLRSGDIFSVLAVLENVTARVAELEAVIAGTSGGRLTEPQGGMP